MGMTFDFLFAFVYCEPGWGHEGPCPEQVLTSVGLNASWRCCPLVGRVGGMGGRGGGNWSSHLGTAHQVRVHAMTNTARLLLLYKYHRIAATNNTLIPIPIYIYIYIYIYIRESHRRSITVQTLDVDLIVNARSTTEVVIIRAVMAFVVPKHDPILEWKLSWLHCLLHFADRSYTWLIIR